MLTIFSQMNASETFAPKSSVRLDVGNRQSIGKWSAVSGRRARQAGFSLVELMIALTIGMIISLAISVIFAQVSSGFRSTDDGSRATENGNFALRTIGEDLRMAGFVGLFNDPARFELDIGGMIASAAADNCGTDAWPWPIANPGVEHIANPGVLPCIPAGTFLATSPALVVRHASGIQTLPADLVANDNLFVQSSPSGGIIFRGSNYAANVKAADRYAAVCGFAAGACTEPRPEAPIFQYLTHVYYVRPCSRPAGAACTAADDGGQPIPTLVRRQLNGGIPAGFVEVPIAEGVERLSVSYGVDGNGDGAPEYYVPGPAPLDRDPTAAEVGQAITVRISVLMRTREQEGHNDAPFTYTLADGLTFNCTANLAPCQYRRYLLSDTVVLKNYAYQR